MNATQELNLDQPDAAREDPGAPIFGTNGASQPAARRVSRPTPGDSRRSARASSPPLDSWALLELLVHRWGWLVLGAAVFAAAGAFGGRAMWRPNYTCVTEMVRYDPPMASDAFRPRALTTPTLIAMIQSPALLQRVGSQLHPPQSAAQLANSLQVSLDRVSDITTVAVSGGDLQATADLANLFSKEAIAATQRIQKEEATEASAYVAQQLRETDTDIADLKAKGPEILAGRLIQPAASDKLADQIEAAREDLSVLLLQYTENHPLVRAQRAKVEALIEQKARAPKESPPSVPRAMGGSAARAGGLGTGADRDPDFDLLRTEQAQLDANRAMLINRQRAIQNFKDNPPGYFRVSVSATTKDALVHDRWLRISLFAVLCAIVGLVGTAGQILFLELVDNRLKTPADVERVTGLPVMATLGDLRHLTPAEQDLWAFRTWTTLQNRLSPSPNHGIVCGFTSAQEGEGRTTWVRLMARAANQCGFRVLTISARANTTKASNGADGKRSKHSPTSLPEPIPPESTALTTNVLAVPAQITEKLMGPHPEPIVHIPLPGWVWNLERRKQWHDALESWRKIDKIVILAELPPASVPETVLLGQNLPNLIWLTESAKSDASETASQLETLRDARCNLVGSVLNRQIAPPVKRRFTRWLGDSAAAVGILCLLSLSRAMAQDAENPQQPTRARSNISIHVGPHVAPIEPSTPKTDSGGPSTPVESGSNAEPVSVRPTLANGSFSVVTPARKAQWQEHLTLGPGDILAFRIFGQPELTREDVPIGPDGRISYLEAENVVAAGLTVDEFRESLGQELGKFRRSPQVYVYPISYQSKKYFVLGAVVKKGVFTLDRPTTIIEAVARARGLETTATERNVVETADFSRSFLARQGQHLGVDFEKLFLQGDLSQNVPIEPGDYLYFPAGSSQQIYVLGEVRNPGTLGFGPNIGTLAAIAMRGGFTDRAWKQRLMVVRGSLNHPDAFIVDANAVLMGQAPDFKLEPKDIVYVCSRPWIRVEEILDLAATAFVESAVVTWTDVHAGPKFH